jgi:chlorite dismutase
MAEAEYVSEVAQLRRQITNEYVAAKWGLSGLAAGYSRHQFITARQERIVVLHDLLQTIIGKDQAIKVVAETLAEVPERATRQHIDEVLQHEMGDTEEAAHLIDWIRDMWETIDLLKARFGKEAAHTIIEAPSYISYSEVCPS